MTFKLGENEIIGPQDDNFDQPLSVGCRIKVIRYLSHLDEQYNPQITYGVIVDVVESAALVRVVHIIESKHESELSLEHISITPDNDDNVIIALISLDEEQVIRNVIRNLDIRSILSADKEFSYYQSTNIKHLVELETFLIKMA